MSDDEVYRLFLNKADPDDKHWELVVRVKYRTRFHYQPRTREKAVHRVADYGRDEVEDVHEAAQMAAELVGADVDAIDLYVHPDMLEVA